MSETRETGYAWVVVGAAFMLNLLASAGYNILGLYMVEALHYFNTTKAAVAWIGVCSTGIGQGAGIFVGMLMKRSSARTIAIGGSMCVVLGFLVSGLCTTLLTLYIFYGVVCGVGFGCFYMSAIVSVQQYFSTHRALASAIISTGFNIGTFILPPVTRSLMDYYGWQGSFIVIAGIMTQGIIFGSLLRPLVPTLSTSKTKDTPIQNSSQSISDGNLEIDWLEMIPLALLHIGLFLIAMGNFGVYPYIPIKCDAIGISKFHVAILISLLGVSGLLSLPVIAWFGDLHLLHRATILGGSAALAGTCSLISTQLSGVWQMMLYAVVYGAINCGYTGMIGAVLADVAGMARLEVTVGTYSADIGLGNVPLHLLSGYLMDSGSSVATPFYIFGLAQLAGGLMITAVPPLQRLCKRKAGNTDIHM